MIGDVVISVFVQRLPGSCGNLSIVVAEEADYRCQKTTVRVAKVARAIERPHEVQNKVARERESVNQDK